MKKRIVLGAFILTLVLFCIGIYMISNSINFGQSEGFKAIQKSGGSMDTQKYLIIVESAIENYRTTGMIISFIGGLGVLISSVGIYKEL